MSRYSFPFRSKQDIFLPSEKESIEALFLGELNNGYALFEVRTNAYPYLSYHSVAPMNIKVYRDALPVAVVRLR